MRGHRGGPGQLGELPPVRDPAADAVVMLAGPEAMRTERWGIETGSRGRGRDSRELGEP